MMCKTRPHSASNFIGRIMVQLSGPKDHVCHVGRVDSEVLDMMEGC